LLLKNTFYSPPYFYFSSKNSWKHILAKLGRVLLSTDHKNNSSSWCIFRFRESGVKFLEEFEVGMLTWNGWLKGWFE
jgi:hypothetical protein